MRSFNCIQDHSFKKSSIQETLNFLMCADSSTDTKKSKKEEKKILKFKVMSKVSSVTCHVSCLMCHVLHVACHLSHVTNTNSHTTDPPSACSLTMHKRHKIIPIFRGAISATSEQKLHTPLCLLHFVNEPFCNWFFFHTTSGNGQIVALLTFFFLQNPYFSPAN